MGIVVNRPVRFQRVGVWRYGWLGLETVKAAILETEDAAQKLASINFIQGFHDEVVLLMEEIMHLPLCKVYMGLILKEPTPRGPPPFSLWYRIASDEGFVARLICSGYQLFIFALWIWLLTQPFCVVGPLNSQFLKVLSPKFTWNLQRVIVNVPEMRLHPAQCDVIPKQQDCAEILFVTAFVFVLLNLPKRSCQGLKLCISWCGELVCSLGHWINCRSHLGGIHAATCFGCLVHSNWGCWSEIMGSPFNGRIIRLDVRRSENTSKF